jgi:hypothetical protein
MKIWKDIIRTDLKIARDEIRLDSTRSGRAYGPEAGSCEHNNELYDFTEDGECIDQFQKRALSPAASYNDTTFSSKTVSKQLKEI